MSRCQRCGAEGADGWWCGECAPVAAHLQQSRGLSMAQVAAMGEADAAEAVLPELGWKRERWLMSNEGRYISGLRKAWQEGRRGRRAKSAVTGGESEAA